MPDAGAQMPNVARIYDCLLGGKDNVEADRMAARQVVDAVPEAARFARENRDFLGRAVRFMIGHGVDQFIDVGTGLPTNGHVHQVTADECPDARVVYVDIDPVVLVHARALIPPNGRTAVVEGDMRNPETIIDYATTRKLIDFSRPVGVLLVAMLHFAADEDDPARIVRSFTAPLAAGSAVAISHVTSDGPSKMAVREVEAIYANASAPGTARSRTEITALFSGLDLVPPGVVSVPDWRPDTPERHRHGRSQWLLGGVGVVPAGRPTPQTRLVDSGGATRFE